MRFTYDSKHKNENINELLKVMRETKESIGMSEDDNISVFIAGKANTGKHTIVSILCKYAGKYQDLPSELFELSLTQGFKIADGPYKMEDTKSKFPLFHTPTEIGQEESQAAQ